MGFGQYSTQPQPRRSKSEMLDSVRGVNVVKSKTVARNTLQYTDDAGYTRIRLHDTDVVTICPDGSVALNTGGYNTLTTRDRMNSFAPDHVRVWTDKGIIKANGVPFAEKCSIAPDGTVTPDKTLKQILSKPKMIDAFITKFKKEFPKADMAGDPWMISGSLASADVAFDWLESGYVFNSLLYHAHIASGMSERGAHMMLNFAISRGLSNYDTGRIRRYFKRALGI